MIRRIQVDTFLEELGTGVSRPVLILGNDYEQYILKNEESDNGGNRNNFNCMFLNEILAYQIGKYLDIPMPEAVIASVDGRLIEEDPKIRFAYRFKEGCYFASKELENVENNILDNSNILRKMGKSYINRSWNAFFSNITNKKDAAKILAFDLLIANFDRYGNQGNILIDNSSRGREIFAIDHGHAFHGPEWTPRKIDVLKNVDISYEYVNLWINGIIKSNVENGNLNGLGVIFKELETYIDLNELNNHSFQDVVMKIEMITEDDLDEWMSNVPDEWFINKPAQITYYKKFILDQKGLIRIFIQVLAERNAFSNFKGGILEWKIEKQFGIA